MKRIALLAFAVCTLTSTQVSAQAVAYANATTFGGQGLPNGGTADQAGNLITRMVMDDITPDPQYAGLSVNSIVFSVFNGNATAVSARPRIRFWNADGPGGSPGTYFAGANGNVGFTFSAISFPANGTQLFNFDPNGTPNTFLMPSSTFWVGLTFDNNTGATGATQAQMDLLGQLYFNPPTVGSSTDNVFVTTSAGSFFGVSNPAGALFNNGGTPVANLGFQFSVVPEPSSMALLGLTALAGIGLRRRKAAK